LPKPLLNRELGKLMNKQLLIITIKLTQDSRPETTAHQSQLAKALTKSRHTPSETFI
jgi:hypothetical protein